MPVWSNLKGEIKMVRAKFRVTKIAKTVSGSAEAVEITLTPEYDKSIPEDQNYAKYTPSGTIQLYVDNPAASDQLALGKFFYVDFNEVEQAQAAG
jgi:hypothetical protein